MIFKRGIDRVRIMVRRDNAADVCEFGNVADTLDFAPVLAAVFGDLQQTIIGADVDQSFFLLRFRQR